MLPAKKDVWGEDVDRNELGSLLSDVTGIEDNDVLDLTGRLLDNFLLPATITKYDEDRTDRELKDLFGSTKEKVLPTQKTIDKTITINKEDYRLTSDEYNHSKEIFGKTSKELIDTFINSSGYNKLSDDEKADMIDKIYSYAKEEIKADYAKKHNLEFTSNSTKAKDMFNTINEVKKAGGKAEDYINYLSGVSKLTSKAERMDFLNKMNLKKDVKEAIYSNDVATYTFVSQGKDEHYDTIKAINGKISNSYTDYIQKSAEGYFKGKNKKQLVQDFINKSDATSLERYYIYVKEGYVKSLTKNQRDRLRKALEENQDKINPDTYESVMKKLNSVK